MITRNDILCEAVERCMQDAYALAQPTVSWDDFINQNKKYKEESKGAPKYPKPYEFYYLPKEVFQDVVDRYIAAYKIESSFEDHLDIILNYFKEPTIDKYIKEEGKPGYRGYEKLQPLSSIIGNDNMEVVKDYIEKARNFYRFNYELNSFNMSVYLGASPNSNKENVIENWKKYRNKDITIDDSAWDDFFE